MRKLLLCLLAMFFCFSPAQAVVILYSATLNGANESPPNASAGTGVATVTVDTVLNTMRVQASFSGLTGTTTAAHIHGNTAVPGTGVAGVATTTPSFVGFPLGVTAGSMDQTYDMTLASSYNAAFVTANGGTTAGARAALFSGLAAGTTYFNIHTSAFGAGEIRGFLTAPAASAPELNAANCMMPALFLGFLLLGASSKRKAQTGAPL